MSYDEKLPSTSTVDDVEGTLAKFIPPGKRLVSLSSPGSSLDLCQATTPTKKRSLNESRKMQIHLGLPVNLSIHIQDRRLDLPPKASGKGMASKR